MPMLLHALQLTDISLLRSHGNLRIRDTEDVFRAHINLSENACQTQHSEPK